MHLRSQSLRFVHVNENVTNVTALIVRRVARCTVIVVVQGFHESHFGFLLCSVTSVYILQAHLEPFNECK